MSTQPRNPKRARKKEGQQRRRDAQLAALKRRRRTNQIKRAVIIGVLVLGGMFLYAQLTKDDKETDVSATSSSTTVALDSTDLECAEPDGTNTDLTKKPTVDVPGEPATELSCRDLVIGDGPTVKEGDTITVHYVGVAQSNGKEFDTSWGGDPASFALTRGGLIDGWVDGIPGMNVGGRRRLTIPGDQAYGPAGRPPDIGPNDTLVFIVDITDDKPAG